MCISTIGTRRFPSWEAPGNGGWWLTTLVDQACVLWAWQWGGGCYYLILQRRCCAAPPQEGTLAATLQRHVPGPQPLRVQLRLGHRQPLEVGVGTVC